MVLAITGRVIRDLRLPNGAHQQDGNLNLCAFLNGNGKERDNER